MKADDKLIQELMDIIESWVDIDDVSTISTTTSKFYWHPRRTERDEEGPEKAEIGGRMTKNQLKQRIEDMVAGACGRRLVEGEDWITVEELSSLIPALMATFPDLPDFLWKPHCLRYFDSPAAITDHLWSQMKH